MNIADAERAVVSEWHRWSGSQNLNQPASGTEGLIFYGYLTQKRPDLLTFRCSGDRWQRVHAWLLSHRLVID